MSYSISIPNVRVDSDREELKARVLDTAAAIGITNESENWALLNRITVSAETALEFADGLMELSGDSEINIVVSGHISQGENDWDTCNIGVSHNPKGGVT